MDSKLVLIVDDDPVFASLLTRVVKECGLRAEVARHGREGLRMMRARRPDLVLLDVLMPAMNGDEVLAAMRADPGLRDVPVIVVSSREPPAGSILCEVPTVPKAFEWDELTRLICEAVEQGGRSSGDGAPVALPPVRPLRGRRTPGRPC
jgi:CheY-like chemotaxis protein